MGPECGISMDWTTDDASRSAENTSPRTEAGPARTYHLARQTVEALVLYAQDGYGTDKTT